jgi:hypothetical protein
MKEIKKVKNERNDNILLSQDLEVQSLFPYEPQQRKMIIKIR